MWVLLEIKIYLDSKLRDVRLAQFMSELLPVLERFSPRQATQQRGMQGETGGDGIHNDIRLLM